MASQVFLRATLARRWRFLASTGTALSAAGAGVYFNNRDSIDAKFYHSAESEFSTSSNRKVPAGWSGPVFKI